MSYQYYEDPYGSSHRRVNTQSYQPSNNSYRRNVPGPSSDFVFQSTFQPYRDRNRSPPLPPPPPPSNNSYHGEYSHSNRYPNWPGSSSNRTNYPSNDQPSHRRYRLEVPSNPSPVRHFQPYQNNTRDISRPSARSSVKNEQPSTNHRSVSQSYRADRDYPRYERNSDQNNRRHHREETYNSSPSYAEHLNDRSVNFPSARQHSNSNHVRSFANPSVSSSRPIPVQQTSRSPLVMQVHHPAAVLTHFLQSLFGGRNQSFDDEQNSSPSVPIDLIAFSWLMQRPDVPATLQIHFGDLFDFLAHDETPSVGLSDDDIQRIPTMSYRKSRKSKSTDDKCAICLSDYKSGETVKRLRCEHFFHPECIDPWLKTSNQCPICRAKQND